MAFKEDGDPSRVVVWAREGLKETTVQASIKTTTKESKSRPETYIADYNRFRNALYGSSSNLPVKRGRRGILCVFHVVCLHGS